MIALCLDEQREFGIVWLSDDGLKEIGCTARVAEVLEQMDDGRMNILVRGGTPFRLLERQEEHAYPAGTVELLGDRAAPPSRRRPAARRASATPTCSRASPTSAPSRRRSRSCRAYEMAASVDIDLDVKQGLLELRSEEARLRLLARLFKAGDQAPRARARRSPTARRATARSTSASGVPVSGSSRPPTAAPPRRGSPAPDSSPGRAGSRRAACAPPK